METRLETVYLRFVAMFLNQLGKLDQRDLSYLDTLRPLVAPSLRSGCYSLGPSGCLNNLDPLVSLSNYYLESVL